MELDNLDHEVLANHIGPEVIRFQPRESVPGRARACKLILEHTGAVSEPHDPGGDDPMIRAQSDVLALQGLCGLLLKVRREALQQPGQGDFEGGVRFPTSRLALGLESLDLLGVESGGARRSVAHRAPMDSSPWPLPWRASVGMSTDVRVGLVHREAEQPANFAEPPPDVHGQSVRSLLPYSVRTGASPQAGHAWPAPHPAHQLQDGDGYVAGKQHIHTTPRTPGSGVGGFRTNAAGRIANRHRQRVRDKRLDPTFGEDRDAALVARAAAPTLVRCSELDAPTSWQPVP